MKKLAAIPILCFMVSASLAQIVSDNTNAIHLNFNEASEEQISLPKISWSFPTSLYTNSQERRVKFTSMISSSSPLVEVTLKLARSEEESDVYASRPVEIPAGSYEFQVDQTLNLINGENVISLTATNEEGGTVSDRRHVLIGLDALSKAVDVNRKDYGLFIATDKYDQWSDLVNPVFDSESIAKELQDTYGFETEMLLNPDQDDILIKIKEYSTRKYKPQDQLIIFVAGHGEFDEAFSEGYLVARDSKRNDEGKTSYIAHSILRSLVDNIPCDHILLVMDVCFSGTFDPVIARRGALYEDIDDSEMLVRLLSKKTRRYLTSGGKEYVSDGVPGKHSPFANRFLEVLRGRGGADRIVTLSDIYATMQRMQTLPRTGAFGENEKESDFVFVVTQ